MWAEITGALGSSARHCGTLSSEDNKQGGAFGLAWLGKVLVSHAARRGERLGETKHAQQLFSFWKKKNEFYPNRLLVGTRILAAGQIGALSYTADSRHIPKNLALV